MKAFCIATIIAVFLFFCTNRIQAQTTQTKPDQGIQLPQLSLEQKLDRASRNISSREIVAIVPDYLAGVLGDDLAWIDGLLAAWFR